MTRMDRLKNGLFTLKGCESEECSSRCASSSSPSSSAGSPSGSSSPSSTFASLAASRHTSTPSARLFRFCSAHNDFLSYLIYQLLLFAVAWILQLRSKPIPLHLLQPGVQGGVQDHVQDVPRPGLSRHRARGWHNL